MKVPQAISKVSITDYLKHEYYRKVIDLVRDRRVLDAGCTEHDIRSANTTRLWNHWFIHNLARSAVGIDIDTQSLEAMTKMGFKVVEMDAETLAFDTQFDTVFAGELIEHLKNPGLFLVAAAKALKSNGTIVLSTPNTYSLARLVRVFQQLTNDPPVNPDHTAYFTPKVITKLVTKCGLKVNRIEYAHFPFSRPTPLIALNQIVCKLIGERFKEQMLVFIGKKQ